MSTLQPRSQRRGASQYSTTQQTGPLTDNQKTLVNFSVRAQDFILKKGLGQAKMSAQTIDVDDIALGIGSRGPGRNYNNFLDESIEGGPSTQSVGFVPGVTKMNAH
jgi:hypothetical protein